MLTRRDILTQTGNLIVTSSIIAVIVPYFRRNNGVALAGVKVYKDIRVLGAGTVTPLSAEAILRGTAFSGKLNEGSHTHSYSLSSDQIKQIAAGKVLKFDSGLASDGSGHKHTVTVNPANLLKGGKSVQVFESENADKIAARLGNGDQPYLYVEGTEDLDPATVKMCIGALAQCQSEKAFSILELVEGLKNRQVFGSVDHITIEDDTTIHIWAMTKSGKQAKIIATINR